MMPSHDALPVIDLSAVQCPASRAVVDLSSFLG